VTLPSIKIIPARTKKEEVLVHRFCYDENNYKKSPRIYCVSRLFLSLKWIKTCLADRKLFQIRSLFAQVFISCWINDEKEKKHSYVVSSLFIAYAKRIDSFSFFLYL